VVFHLFRLINKSGGPDALARVEVAAIIICSYFQNKKRQALLGARVAQRLNS